MTFRTFSKLVRLHGLPSISIWRFLDAERVYLNWLFFTAFSNLTIIIADNSPFLKHVFKFHHLLLSPRFCSRRISGKDQLRTVRLIQRKYIVKQVIFSCVCAEKAVNSCIGQAVHTYQQSHTKRYCHHRTMQYTVKNVFEDILWKQMAYSASGFHLIMYSHT